MAVDGLLGGLEGEAGGVHMVLVRFCFKIVDFVTFCFKTCKNGHSNMNLVKKIVKFYNILRL